MLAPMNNPYENLAGFYDNLMNDVDYYKLSNYYDDFLKQNKDERGILLDLGCGTGRLSTLMAEIGWDVIGIDGSPDMLSNAKTHKNVSYICQDMNELDLYGTVDGAICSLDGLNHLTFKDELFDTIKRVSLFMNPECYFCFDVNTLYKHEKILGDNTFIKEHTSANGDIFCVWQNFYEGDGLTDISLDIFAENSEGGYNRFSDNITEKAYTLKEIKSICNDCGFDKIKTYNFLTLDEIEDIDEINIYTKKYEKVVFVCRKKVV